MPEEKKETLEEIMQGMSLDQLEQLRAKALEIKNRPPA